MKKVVLILFVFSIVFLSCSKKEAVIDIDRQVHNLTYSLTKLKDDYLQIYVNNRLADSIPTGFMKEQFRVPGVFYLTNGTDSATFTVRRRGETKDLISLKLPVDKASYTYPGTMYYYGDDVKTTLQLPVPAAGKAAYCFRNLLIDYQDIPVDMKIFKVVNGTYTETVKIEAITNNKYSNVIELDAPPSGGNYAIRLYKSGTGDLVPSANPYTPFLTFKAGESVLANLNSSGSNISLVVYLKQ